MQQLREAPKLASTVPHGNCILWSKGTTQHHAMPFTRGSGGWNDGERGVMRKDREAKKGEGEDRQGWEEGKAVKQEQCLSSPPFYAAGSVVYD